MDQFQQNGNQIPPYPQQPQNNNQANYQQPQQAPGYQQPQQAPGYQQPMYYNQQPNYTNSMPNYTGMAAVGAEPVAKKSKAPKIIAGIVGGVVLVGAGSGIAYAASDTVKNFARANFTSDESYFAWVMEKNATESAQKMKDRYARYLDLMDSSTSKIGIAAEFSDTTKDLILDAMDGTSAEGLELDSAAIEGNLVHTDGNYGVTASLIANDTNLLDLNLSYSQDDQAMYLQIPSLSDDYISFSTSDLEEELEADWGDENPFPLDALFSSDTFRDILSPEELEDLYVRYTNVLTEALDDDVQVHTRENVEVGNLEFSTTEIELGVDEETAASAVCAILKEAKNDSVIQDIAVTYGDMSEEDYKDTVQELIDELDDAADSSSNDTVCTLSLYVDATGTICGINMDIPDTCTIYSFAGFDTKHAGVAFRASIDGEDLADMTVELDRDGKSFSGSGEASFCIDEETYTASLEIDGLEVVDRELGYVKGDVTISIPDLVDRLTLRLDSDGNAQTISADLAYDGDDYGTISLTYGIDSASSHDISLPDANATIYNGDDDDALDEYADNIDVDAFYATLEDALGIPDAEAFLNDLFSDDYTDDDDDWYDDDDDWYYDDDDWYYDDDDWYNDDDDDWYYEDWNRSDYYDYGDSESTTRSNSSIFHRS